MTTDFRALCAELTDCLEKADWPHKQKHVFEQWIYIARKALAEPEPEVYYEFTVLNDEYCTEAGGTAPTMSQAIDEGRHYFAQYSQDGQYTLEVRRVEVIPVPS